MSATKVLSSAKRKKTKPHKLGEKKRLYLSSDEDVVPRPHEAVRDSSEENLSNSENSPAQVTAGGNNKPRGRGRTKGSKNKTSSSAILTSRESSEESQEGWTNSPPAHTAEGSSQECREGAPRGRGRPKGSKNKSLSNTHLMIFKARNGQDHKTIQRTASPTKERPRRAEVPHRGRGRPKGTTKKVLYVSEQASPQVTKQPTGENTPKRARGRPKGSPNKKLSKAALMLKYGIPKLGRGRPKKIVATNGAVVPKRGRGRPKGSGNKMPKARNVRKIGVSPGGTGLKKRGRPRKNVSRVAPPPPPPPSSAIKRSRGRPKHSVPEVEEYGENVEYEDSVSE